MSDKPIRRPDFTASVNNVPSALDEMQFRRVLRDMGNIEAKGLQQRATASEMARSANHVIESFMSTTLTASRMRDIANEELTAQEFTWFDARLRELEDAAHQGHKRTLETGFSQMKDNMKQQPIETAKEIRQEKRRGWGKKILTAIGFEEVEEKGKE